jgi:hypothetical protein
MQIRIAVVAAAAALINNPYRIKLKNKSSFTFSPIIAMRSVRKSLRFSFTLSLKISLFADTSHQHHTAKKV